MEQHQQMSVAVYQGIDARNLDVIGYKQPQRKGQKTRRDSTASTDWTLALVSDDLIFHVLSNKLISTHSMHTTM